MKGWKYVLIGRCKPRTLIQLFDMFEEISVEMEQDETVADKSPAEPELTSTPILMQVVLSVSCCTYVKNFDSLSFVLRQDRIRFKSEKASP
jgi:hypothetical protein